MKTPSPPTVIESPGLASGGALLAFVVAASMALAACGAAATSAPSSSPGASPGGSPAPSEGPSPSPSPPGTPIEHPTAPTDVVFRFEEGGGFVPMGFFATEAPAFTLYGDGTVIFKDGNSTPPPDSDGIIRTPAYGTITLTEDQVQAFLDSVIADGGLGVARDYYESPGADLPTATFTLIAGGMTRSVSVMALGMERGDGKDAEILRALAGLGERLRDFGREVEGQTTWVPDRWRGVLTPDSLSPPRPWPWPDVSPVEFVEQPGPDAPRFPVRTMSPDEIADLGLPDIDGGFSGLGLSGPDGRTYLFALRPIFPDEQY